MKKSLFWKSNKGSRLKIVKKCKIFISAIIAINISYYLTSGICTAEVLPKPCYENIFYIAPVSDNYYHDGGVCGDISLATFFGTNFGQGSSKPYARGGAAVRPSVTAVKADIDQKVLDYKFKDSNLEDIFLTAELGNCPISFEFAGGLWSHGYAVAGSLGNFIASNPMWKSDYIPEPHGDEYNNSRYNTVYHIYKRRNHTAMLRRIIEWWKEHPDLVISIGKDAESSSSGTTAHELCNLEYQDWRSDVGIYGDNLTLPLWFHDGQTGVSDVVFAPGGFNISLSSTTDYEVRIGYSGSSTHNPFYAMILIYSSQVPQAEDYDIVEYKVIGGEDDGKAFKSRLEDYRGQGRIARGVADDTMEFRYWMTDHIVEDMVKWVYREMVVLGYDTNTARKMNYSHEVPWTRWDARWPQNATVEFGCPGHTTSVDASKASDCRQMSIDSGAGGNWCAPEGHGSQDLTPVLQYGGKLCSPYHWPDYASYLIEAGVNNFRTYLNRLGWSPYKLGEDNYNSGNYNDADIYDPPVVKNVQTEVVSPTEAKIIWHPYIWTDVANSQWTDWPQFQNFKVYRSQTSGELGTELGSPTTFYFTDSSVPAGQCYYTVSAVNTSSTEGEQTQLPLYRAMLSNLTISQNTDGSGLVEISMLMDHEYDNDCRLKIEYSIDSGSTWQDPYIDEINGVIATYGFPFLDNTTSYQVSDIETVSGANAITF